VLKRVFIALLAALSLAAGIACVRAILFPSRQIDVPSPEPIKLDRDPMLKRLSRAVQYRTVSFTDPKEASVAEFDRFHRFLVESFPAVHAHLTAEVVSGHSLLYIWHGRDRSLKPILLMGHMDVVPVDSGTESSWTHPPFSGDLAEGYIWGRGTMDDKVNVLGILEALEHLLAQGFEPRRSIYIAFGHDEEIGGYSGAAKIAEVLAARGIQLEFALDEGANVLDGIIPDVAAPVALIGIAEKGYVSLELTAEAAGGHASIPPSRTAIGILSGALARLESSPPPSRVSAPVRSMFEYLGPEMAWSRKIVFANLWLFEPLVRSRFAKSPLTNAAIRTTYAASIFEAGIKENVLPARARAIVNTRILPGDTIAGVLDHVRKTIDDPEVRITPLTIRAEPSPIADTESGAFKLLHRTIKEVAPEALVAPSLLVAATDSRHYARLTQNIFRFLPITLRPEDTARYHGIDERISVRDYERCVRFYVQLLRNSQS
jgi:carboxypeptidase PM20D1